ncbi:MAG: HEAT repeat domain-containing protein [Pirellulales bacterium]
MSATSAFAWLVAATAMGFVLSALGAAVVLLLREPARRVRAIELTLLACLVAPWLPAVPGLPRVAWREWLAAATDVAEKEAGGDVAALPEPTVPSDVSVASEPAERASAPPIIELAVVPEPSDASRVDLTIDREPMTAVVAPIEQAEVPTAVVATAAEPVAPSPPPPAVELPATRQLDWQAVVVSLYLAGVAAIISLDALGGLALLRVWKSARRAEPKVQELVREVAGQNSGRVSLLVSPRCRQPFTFAWLWPVIVLPPALIALGKERELRWALVHEWSHVANRHTWGWALAGLARAIYWPQPLVWLLRRRLRLEQDFLADAQAAGRAADAPDYATFLTTQAATAHGLTPGLGIAGGKSELARRVVMLVQGKRPVAKCGWGWSAGLAVAMIACVILAASFAQQPNIAAAEDQEAPSAAKSGEEASKEQPGDLLGETAKAEDEKALEKGPPVTPGGGERAIEPWDLLTIDAVGVPSLAQPSERSTDERAFSGFVNRDGEVLLSARFGSVAVAGLSIAEAEAKVLERLKTVLQEDVGAGRIRNSNFPVVVQIKPAGMARSLMLVRTPSRKERRLGAGDEVRVTTNGASTTRPPEGRFVVEQQGTLALGPRLGRVEVKGLTPEQAGERILERIRDAAPKFNYLPDLVRANATVSVTFVDDEQSVPEAEYVPLPTPGQRITSGNRVGIEAIGPNLELKLLGSGSVDSAGRLSLRRTGERYLRRPGDSLWLVGLDSDIQAAGLTEKELEAAVRRELEKTGPVPWLAVRLGGYDTRAPGWVESASNQPSNGDAAARRTAARGGPKPNLRYAGKSFDQWREVLQNDLDPATRVEAIKALGKFGANGLAKEAAEAIAPYIGFRDGDENVVYATAQEEMAKLGQPAVAVVAAALASPDAKLREGAGHVFMRMPADEPALAALVKALDDQVPAVRIAAAGALGVHRHELDRAGAALEQAAQLGEASLLPQIASLLLEHFTPTDARLQIASDYMDRESPQNLPGYLFQGGKNADFVVALMQLRLERALKQWSANPTEGQQRGRRRDGSGFIGPLATLERLGPKAKPALPTILKVAEIPVADLQRDLHTVQILRAIGPDAEPIARPVIERLFEQSTSPNRKGYFHDLLRFWDEARDKPLAAPDQTEVKPPEIRRQYAGKSFAEWQAVLEKDLDPATRIEAIAAIGEFGANGQAEDAIRVLIPWLGSQAHSDKQWVATAAQQALSKIGAPAVPALIERLKNGDSDSQLKATEAFINMGDAAAPAADALLDLAKAKASEPDWQRPLVRAIASIQSRPEATLPFLKAMASSHNQDVRATAIHGLSGLKASDEEVVPLVVNSIWSYSGAQGRSNFFQHLPIGGGRTAAVLRGLLERAKKDVAGSDGMVQVLFIRAGEMGPAAAPLVPLMIEVSQQDPSWQGAAIYLVQALERIGPGAKEALPNLRAMRDGQTDPGLRKLVKAAINAIEGSQ